MRTPDRKTAASALRERSVAAYSAYILAKQTGQNPELCEALKQSWLEADRLWDPPRKRKLGYRS